VWVVLVTFWAFGDASVKTSFSPRFFILNPICNSNIENITICLNKPLSGVWGGVNEIAKY